MKFDAHFRVFSIDENLCIIISFWIKLNGIGQNLSITIFNDKFKRISYIFIEFINYILHLCLLFFAIFLSDIKMHILKYLLELYKRLFYEMNDWPSNIDFTWSYKKKSDDSKSGMKSWWGTLIRQSKFAGQLWFLLYQFLRSNRQ